MISGTPDVFFLLENTNLIIWDFKTGQRDEQNESSYWLQLMCYAYGLGKIYRLENDIIISFSLLYLDQKKIITKEMSLTEISQEVFSIWKKTESLYQVNKNHCSQCEYSGICKKSNA
jgi:hypothetical protein